ncbi:glycine zipper domain-containing protein [Prosthecobacter sp.]|uniref:glycine zipper domain-containing protein n=1 Tax=Prosthecobacter sp. TaxID=1965333 RepID=UPI002ABB7927|nr:glycine zipper domain-containing protein [Prosthecobacter sp.]MDZ4401771.1 glycine zipper domain-containing protein [Prosthecobacter sp.]
MKTLYIAMLLSSVSLVSCTNGPNARQGTVIGALGGAAVGGLASRSLGGAAVGAGVGALAGNLIGGSQDRNRRRY